MTQTDAQDVQRTIDAREPDVPWYAETIGSQLGPPARKLLEEYSEIPAEEVESHVYKIREAAWRIHPYPCIGQFRFLDISITQSPYFPLITSRVSSGQDQLFLDLGCCFGQDIRALVAAGVPSERLYGADLREEFWELGLELFRDRENLKSQFVQGDILAEDSDVDTTKTSNVLSKGSNANNLKFCNLKHKFSIIHAASFLHLFDYPTQVRVCCRIVNLLHSSKDSIILGRQVGSLVAGEKVRASDPREKMFRHDEESFRGMWREVGEKTGTTWRVEVELLPVGRWAGSDVKGGISPGKGWQDEQVRRLRFAVFRE